MALLTSRSFCGDEDKDDGMQLDDSKISPINVKQLHNSPGKNYDWQDLVPAHKHNDPTIVMIVNQLNDTEAKIKERMKVADELWKARYPTDTSDVDIDELLKELQHHFNAGDKLVKPNLICLHELGDLNRSTQKLISRLQKASDKIHHIDVFPRRELSTSSNVLKNTNGRRFHVVIVGINKYDDPRTPALRGCVNDALLFRSYLMQDLSVPADQITTLLSRTSDEILPSLRDIPFPCNAPTRQNILNALYDLHDNPNIKPNDSIIIFYAGHGQSYRAADAGYECTSLNTGSIEAISPVDRSELVPDISDREINVILGEIAKKCPNITLILDCCHAGGGTRGNFSLELELKDKKNLMPRHCPPISSPIRRMFEVADEGVRLSPDQPHTANPSFRANMKSHVLIAAAKDYQEALEYTDSTTGVTQGYFTSRLLSALRSPLGHNPATTYRDLIQSPDLVMPFQTAVVAGKKTARLWFA
ncbi:caspase domain-containing protein [Rhodocollybia butyracea]|uniref:Caspase domain-containing protein n=1 Tax=Rhodocollybia butyracea TaxID=206335 RepID=A0A9P5P7I2_9AGAR|nr:caspase domain-containing protein [Rhodocollybia butyracea]